MENQNNQNQEPNAMEKAMADRMGIKLEDKAGDAGNGGDGNKADDKANAAAAQQKVFTDDEYLAETFKRYGDKGVKTKEDFERGLSRANGKWFQPKSELVEKLNDYDGDPEEFVKWSKLDLEKLDGKEAVITSWMATNKWTRQQAEVFFKKEGFEKAFGKPEDDGYDEEDKIYYEAKLKTEHDKAKAELQKFKADFTKIAPTGMSKEQLDKIAEMWNSHDSGLSEAVKQLSKISFKQPLKLPDGKEVEGDFNFDLEDSAKAFVGELFNSKTMASPEFYHKLFDALNPGKEKGYAQLVENLMWANPEIRAKMLSSHFSTATSTAFAEHTRMVKSGQLDAADVSKENNQGAPKTWAEAFASAKPAA